MKPHPWLVVVFVGALVGLVFAGVSTYDFVQHLDRQVHSLHCSFIPGGGHDTGESGCQVAMMSSYSSVFRTRVWGGIPIALPAMAVFAFIGLFAIDLLLTRRKDDPRATAFLALASALPALTSIVMLVISLSQLGTTCKLCVGIYTASALCLAGSIALWRRAVRLRGPAAAHVATPKRDARDRADDPAWVSASRELGPAEPAAELAASVETAPTSYRFLGAAFGVGVGFVVVPVIVYLAMAPDHGRFIGTCDGLARPDDSYGVMIELDRGSSGAPAIEILDPLCPACKAFEDRLGRSGYAAKLDRKAILFPLDNTCNWMVTEATHPGACTVSEAVLCAGDRAPEVIAWAFEVQDRVRAETKTDPAAAARIVKQRFPELAACVGSPEARSRLNKSLRWTVANNIRVLTPQLFIDSVKLCDEDVDLGLEYSLRIMLERHDNKTLVNPAAGAVTRPVEAMPHDPADDRRPAGDKIREPVKPEHGAAAAHDRAGGGKTDAAAAGDQSGVSKPEDGSATGDKPGSSKTDAGTGDQRAPGDPERGAASKPKPVKRKQPAESTSDQVGDKPVTSPSAADKPAGDQPVTSPSGAEPGGAP